METFKIVLILVTSFIAVTTLASEGAVEGFDYRFAIGDTNVTVEHPPFQEYEAEANNIVYTETGGIRLEEQPTTGYWISESFSNENMEPFDLIHATADARVETGVLNLTLQTSDYANFSNVEEEVFDVGNGSNSFEPTLENASYYRFRVDLVDE